MIFLLSDLIQTAVHCIFTLRSLGSVIKYKYSILMVLPKFISVQINHTLEIINSCDLLPGENIDT